MHKFNLLSIIVYQGLCFDYPTKDYQTIKLPNHKFTSCIIEGMEKFLDSSSPLDERSHDLISGISIEEKISQVSCDAAIVE